MGVDVLKRFMIWVIAIMVLFSMGCESYGGETPEEAYERGYQKGQDDQEPSESEIEDGEFALSEATDEAFHRGYQEGYCNGYDAGYYDAENGYDYFLLGTL